MIARGFAGRADLLRAAFAVYGEAPADEEMASEGAGARLVRLARVLELHPEAPAAPTDDLPPVVRQGAEAAVTEVPQPAPAVATRRRPPLSAAHFALVEYTVDDAPAAAPALALRPLSSADCQPRAAGLAVTVPPHSPLVGRTRLWPALQRALACPRRGPLDVPALVGELARGHSPQRLPRRLLRHWGGELVVVFDVAQRLLPYDADYRELLREVRRRHGQGGLRLWVVDDSPFSARSARRGPAPIPPPPPGTLVLILSDLGLLAGDPARTQAWQEFTRRLAAHGAQAVAWLPMSPALVPDAALRHCRVHCLDGAHALRALRPRGLGEAADPGEHGGWSRVTAALQALLLRIACCVRVEPGLLRALRRIAPDTAAEPGLEAIVWALAPVIAAGGRFCEIAPEHVAAYRARFGALSVAEQEEILRRVLAAHARRGRSTESAELLIWRAHARPEAVANPEFAAPLEDAGEWFARFGVSAAGEVGDTVGYASDLLARHGGDRAWLAASSPLLAPIWALTGKDEIPDGLDAADVAAARARSGQPLASARSWRLLQHDDRFSLQPDRRQPGRWPTIRVEGGLVCRAETDTGGQQAWIEAGAAPLSLPVARAPDLNGIALYSGGRRYRLAPLRRPPWAKEVGRDAYGLYLDVELRGVAQRLRWIEPGEFLMGSPDDEAGRDADEGPRHPVRLTTGYWLADTACTQALWLAVMGENPSEFKDDARKPVENVSWDDVQGFLDRVAALLTGVEVALPTEAEWEYACRAGSDTTYHWGERIAPEQANYQSMKQRTMPVKSHAANAWGFYEMHGNVWEWCADGKRDYGDDPQENPRGPEGVAARALRGGSWYGDARYARSAFRFAEAPGRRGRSGGFRFALRSTGQAASAECLRQEFRPEGLVATQWSQGEATVSAVFPEREDGAASAEAEPAPSGFGKLRKKIGAWFKAPEKKGSR